MGLVLNYQDLDIWNMGMEIVLDVYRITRTFPKDERYGLTSQSRRAAVSIPINIAEGFDRYYRKEKARFVSISSGSCAELDTLMRIALALEYVQFEEFEKLRNKLISESKMLASFRSTLLSNNKR